WAAFQSRFNSPHSFGLDGEYLGDPHGRLGSMLRLDLPGYLRADGHSQAEREEHEHALRLRANLFGRDLVSINLACDEEEIVADAVQHDAAEDHPADFIGGAQ